jgi:hypothetical protein
MLGSSNETTRRNTIMLKWGTSAASLLTILALLIHGGSLRSEDKKDDEKIDVEAVKKATKAALVGDKEKLDLSYITEEFIRNAKKEAKEDDEGIRDDTGKVRNKNRNVYTTYGNNYWVSGNRVYFYQGDPGTVESFSCGKKYWRYRDNFSVSYYGRCNGGYPYYQINWIAREEKK